MDSSLYEVEKATTQGLPYNYQGESQATILGVRLDTSQVLERIELFLRGLKVVETTDNKGHVIQEVKEIEGMKPLANEVGIAVIMDYLYSHINSQTVQGNLQKKEFEMFIRQRHFDLNDLIYNNFDKFDINPMGYELIMYTIIPKIELFLSRTIDNKERDSYGIMKVVENITGQGKKDIAGFKAG